MADSTCTPPYVPSVSASKACKCIEKVAYSDENKRKRSLMNDSLDLQDGSLLSLGLGCSLSSGVTVFSGNQIEVDLELSLGSGSASVELDVTQTSSFASFPFTCHVKPPVTTSTMTSAGFHLVDEGSTSSRWKLPILCPVETGVSNVPYLGMPGGSASLDPGLVVQPQPRSKSNIKRCRFIGCTRGARGASGLCISHGGGRRCQREGCGKGAEGKTVFCKAHGGGRRCQFLGCTKSAEGRTDYCIGHGGGRRCSHEGCTHAARGKSGLCIRHGGGKRCKMEGCTKSAEGASGLCISHGGGRRCQYPACTKGAQGSTRFCKAHGGGKRCTFLGCTKGAEGNTSFCKSHGGGKRCTFEGGCCKSVHGGTLFCVSHGGGKRCGKPECTKSARGRTSFCVRHGGGKRCKHEGCGKSAQGRTDFCKAHGGGNGKPSSQVQSKPFVDQTSTPWVKFISEKAGLCPRGITPDDPGLMSNGSACYQGGPVEKAGRGGYSLPEGRVHGGSLMAMLKGCTGGPSEAGEVRHIDGGRWM